MGIFSPVVEAIKAAFRFIRNLVRYIIRGVLNFFAHVVNWFKEIYYLDQERHVPFIADANQLKDMIHSAPTKNVGIFEGVYDEITEEIVEHRQVEADQLDSKTKEVLGNEPLVVLQ